MQVNVESTSIYKNSEASLILKKLEKATIANDELSMLIMIKKLELLGYKVIMELKQ